MRSTLICITCRPASSRSLSSLRGEEETVGRQAGGESELAAVTDDLDHVRMQQRLAAHERDSHRPEIADFADPKLEVLELRMRLRVIVFRAVGAIEIALIGQVEAALERLAIEDALAGFEQVIAGEFAADFIEQVHGIRAARVRHGGRGFNLSYSVGLPARM